MLSFSLPTLDGGVHQFWGRKMTKIRVIFGLFIYCTIISFRRDVIFGNRHTLFSTVERSLNMAAFSLLLSLLTYIINRFNFYHGTSGVTKAACEFASCFCPEMSPFYLKSALHERYRQQRRGCL